MSPPLDPVDVMGAMVLEDGRKWGDIAAPFQLEDAEAVFPHDATGLPRWHFLTRPRGGSKSTDLGAMLLAWLVAEARPAERGYIIASDKDQGAFAVLDAIQGLVRRSPALAGIVDLQASKVIGPGGATVEVMSADGASSWGLRPSFLVCDEVSAWPSTRNARTVWTALVSSLGKIPGCRFVCLSMAGDPAHWSFKVLKEARKSKSWRVNEVGGPLPWVDPAQLEAQRPLLRDSEYARLHLGVWTASEDRLVTEADLEAAAVLAGPLEPRAGVRYVVGLDVGLVNDASIAVVAHAESLGGDGAGHRVVVDRIARWRGSKRSPVVLDEVEAWLRQATQRYNRAKIVADPWQSVGLCQRLRQQGCWVEEFTFSATSVGHIANALHLALRNHTISLPKDEELLAELANIRLRETTPGVVRLDHDAGQHDDQGIAIGLCCVTLEATQVPAGPVILDEEELAGLMAANARLNGDPDAPPAPAKPGHQFAMDTSWAGAGLEDFDTDDEGDTRGRVVRSPFAP